MIYNLNNKDKNNMVLHVLCTRIYMNFFRHRIFVGWIFLRTGGGPSGVLFYQRSALKIHGDELPLVFQNYR